LFMHRVSYGPVLAKKDTAECWSVLFEIWKAERADTTVRDSMS
jgi:hypothetical protein